MPCGTSIEHLSGLSHIFLSRSFEKLAEEATWGSDSTAMCALPMNRRGFNINTHKSSLAKIKEDKYLAPSTKRNQDKPYQSCYVSPGFKMQMAAQEFHKLHEPKSTSSRMDIWPQ